jgi:general secretion pathway protein D
MDLKSVFSLRGGLSVLLGACLILATAAAPGQDRRNDTRRGRPAPMAGPNGGGAEEGAEASAEEPAGEGLDRILEEISSETEKEAPAAPPVKAEEKPTPTKKKSSAPPRKKAAAAAPAERDSIFDEMGLTEAARKEEAKELVQISRDLIANGELTRAEGRLEIARQLDPENLEADRLLSEVRLLLGDQRGAVAEVMRELSAQQKVARDEAVTEIHRLLNDGYRLEEEQNYARAIENYEKAIEAIHRFPFDLRLDKELREAEVRLESAREKKRLKDEEERQAHIRMLQENAELARSADLDYLENQIRELRRKARAAEEQGDYERAVTLYERIIEVNPRDTEARAARDAAEAARHRQRMQRLLELSQQNFELAILGIEESSVIYQQIFRYPDRQDWLRISPKVVSIEEEIAAEETAVEKEIKRKLELPTEIGFEEGVSLQDALRTLQSVSGVNFVLNKEGLEAAADKEVKLERFPDLPLRNVLGLVLQSAGPDFGYAIKEGAVVVGPKTSLKEKLHLRFYEINDLVQDHPDFKSPDLALDELAGKQQTGTALDLGLGEEEEGPQTLGGEKLLEIIGKELGTTDGEGAGAVSILGGKLAARTTFENHLKLSQLLSQLRKSTGVMVTVESRFLDIQDNFLEEIGINMGSGNSTFLPNSIPDIDGAGTSVAPGWEYVNAEGTQNTRLASINNLSVPLGSKVNPFNLSSSGGFAFQYNVLKTERYQLEALLTAVAKEQEIRRLNSPRVTAFNGQVAHTLVVNQAAYIQDLEVNQTGVIPVINPVIDVLNSGSILEVRPTTSFDQKYVVLEIQPTLAEQLDSDQAVLRLSGNFTEVPVELPVVSVTKIKTTVTVPDGGTVLVGGLKREINTKSQIGIPGLLDIPIVNLLWGRKGNSILRSNLFVLLNAKITIVREEEERLFGT